MTEQLQEVTTSHETNGRTQRLYADMPVYSDTERKRLEALYEKSFTSVDEGQILTGRVTSITSDDVIIDIGLKSEGVVPRTEFSNIDDLKIGDTVEVLLEKREDKEGCIQISHKQAHTLRIWERITSSQKNGEIVQVQCVRRIKGGIVVNLFGLDAFLPGSQIDVKPVRDFDQYIGQTLDVKVVKINNPNGNVVVSHKAILEQSISDQRRAIIGSLEKGQVLEGTVKAIADFGAFVDLGGVDGLIHITDLSWGRVIHPSEVVTIDQKVNVVVLEFDEEKRRISLGMKQLLPHPWEKIEERYAKNQVVSGKVVSITEYGAFVEIEKGIEGLIHVSEMSWTQHVKHPSQVVAMGQAIEAIILNIDTAERKISLGMKQLTADPWSTILERYPIGSHHKGIVRSLTNYGAFIELEEGIDGLVHISDLSWTKKLRHPGEMLKKSQEVDVMVMAVDMENHRLSLGLKQLEEDPWENIITMFPVGTQTEGKIIRMIDKGVVVELPNGVDGFVPTSHLTTAQLKNAADAFKVDDTLPLVVIEFNKEERKIVLSVTEYFKGKEQAIVDEYVAKHPINPETLADTAKKKTPRKKKEHTEEPKA